MAHRSWRQCIQPYAQQLACLSGVVGFQTGVDSRFLEEELARKYKEAAPATLAILQQRCDDVGASVNAIAARLNAVQDVASLRKAGQSTFICYLT